jgi:hypothetical protein
MFGSRFELDPSRSALLVTSNSRKKRANVVWPTPRFGRAARAWLRLLNSALQPEPF